MNIDGHCLCGKVGFSVRSEANWSCYCHCEDCRRNCAAPIVAFFGISLEDFSWRIEGGAQEPKFFSPSSGVKLDLVNVYQQKIAFEDTLKTIPRDLPFSIDLDPQTLDWSVEEREYLSENAETS